MHLSGVECGPRTAEGRLAAANASNVYPVALYYNSPFSLLGEAAMLGPMNAAYDSVVIGSGSSGGTVASRLSKDSTVRVLLLEAGGSDRTALVRELS